MKNSSFVNDEEITEDDFSIYSRYNRENQLEDDEISSVEEAFMEGYDSAI